MKITNEELDLLYSKCKISIKEDRFTGDLVADCILPNNYRIKLHNEIWARGVDRAEYILETKIKYTLKRYVEEECNILIGLVRDLKKQHMPDKSIVADAIMEAMTSKMGMAYKLLPSKILNGVVDSTYEGLKAGVENGEFVFTGEDDTDKTLIRDLVKMMLDINLK